jgi:hypothetical protein
MKDDLFDDQSVMKDCIVDNRFNIKAMIDTDATDYCFIDKVTAQKICEMIEISLVRLLKSKNVRAYNDKKSTLITHVIYSFLKIENYLKDITSMMIIELNQQTIILEKS